MKTMRKYLFLLLLSLITTMNLFPDNIPKAVSIEFNSGFLITYGLEFESDINLGILAPDINGLNLHASFIVRMKSIVAETASQFSYCTFAGAGGSGGLRYFFGENGISGFYVGALLLYLHYTVQPSTSSYGTGNHEYSFFVAAGEAGYRFLIGDIFTVTLGLASGYALNSTATGTIVFNPATTGGLPPWDHYSAAMHNFYFEITVGLGFVF